MHIFSIIIPPIKKESTAFLGMLWSLNKQSTPRKAVELARESDSA